MNSRNESAQFVTESFKQQSCEPYELIHLKDSTQKNKSFTKRASLPHITRSTLMVLCPFYIFSSHSLHGKK